MNYECTQCRQPTDRAVLVVKRAVFQTMGKNQKTLRSRTVSWLCPECILRDPDWNQSIYTDSPGLKKGAAKDGTQPTTTAK